MGRSILCISGFAFNLFGGELISAPSNPYLAHLQWLEQELTRVGEHIKASRITHLINVAYTFNEYQFDWDDSIYPIGCEVYQPRGRIMIKEPVFFKGEKVVCVNSSGYPNLTEGKTYIVKEYSPSEAGTAYFTWPAYVKVKDNGNGTYSTGHATRFKKFT